MTETTEIKLVNLTGNDIKILNEGLTIVIKKQSWRARCKVNRIQQFEIEGIPVVRNTKSDLEGVPEPKDNTFYVVSKIVADLLAEKGRTDDILIPDEIVKSREGAVLGCKSLTFS